MSIRVLIVEDDPSLRGGLAAWVAMNGHDVITAGTVAEGVGHLRSGPSHVLLDANLPDGVGTTVLRHVRAEGLPIKVAILSGWGDDAVLMAGDSRPDAVFRKPPNWDALVEWIAA